MLLNSRLTMLTPISIPSRMAWAWRMTSFPNSAFWSVSRPSTLLDAAQEVITPLTTPLISVSGSLLYRAYSTGSEI